MTTSEEIARELAVHEPKNAARLDGQAGTIRRGIDNGAIPGGWGRRKIADRAAVDALARTERELAEAWIAACDEAVARSRQPLAEAQARLAEAEEVFKGPERRYEAAMAEVSTVQYHASTARQAGSAWRRKLEGLNAQTDKLMATIELAEAQAARARSELAQLQTGSR